MRHTKATHKRESLTHQVSGHQRNPKGSKSSCCTECTVTNLPQSLVHGCQAVLIAQGKDSSRLNQSQPESRWLWSSPELPLPCAVKMLPPRPALDHWHPLPHPLRKLGFLHNSALYTRPPTLRVQACAESATRPACL